MPDREEPALFVIVMDTPGSDPTAPAGSPRVAAQVARHRSEHCPHIGVVRDQATTARMPARGKVNIFAPAVLSAAWQTVAT